MPKRRRPIQSRSARKRRRTSGAYIDQGNRLRFPMMRALSNRAGPLPHKLRARLILGNQTNLAMNALDSIESFIFRANGMSSPYVTSGPSGQPRGYDQLTALYDHWTVIGSKITCWVSNNSSDRTFLACLRVSDTTTLGGYRSPLEDRGTSFARVPLRSGGGFAKVTKSVNPAKFLGISKGAVVSNSLLRGASGTDPEEQCFFHLDILTNDADAGAATNVHVIWRIEYEVIFTEPKLVAAS